MAKLDPTLLAEIIEAYERRSSEVAAATDARTVAELWLAWLPRALVTRSPNLRSHGHFVLDMQFKPGTGPEEVTLGKLTPGQCARATLLAWKAALREQLTAQGRLLSPGYCHQIRITLQGCFQWYVDNGGLTANPLKGIPGEDGYDNKREGYFTEQQLEAFCGHCPPVLAAMMRLSYRCGGMRRDEVRTLKKVEIDWENRRLVLKGRNRERVSGKTTGRTKNRRPKHILLTDDALAIVKTYCDTSNGEYVFANPCRTNGQPLPRATMWRWIDNARKACGFDLMGEAPTFHHLRHGFTIANLEKGAPAAWVANQLGVHTKQLDRYGALRGEAEDRMREILNQHVETTDKKNTR